MTWLLLIGSALFFVGVALPFVVNSWDSVLTTADKKASHWEPEWPSVDVIVPAYLERSTIIGKINEVKDALARYQGVTNTVVVASDDATYAAAVEAGSDFVLRVPRGGKPSAVNAGVKQSSADIIVLTDANCTVHPSEWCTIVVHELQSLDLVSAHKREVGGSEGVFWRYESKVKGHSSHECLCVVGEFIAFRRADFRPIPENELLDDLWLALNFANRGMSVGVARNLETYEAGAHPRDQWERRVRIARGAIQGHLPRVLEYASHRAGRRFFAHKMYRLTIGCLGFWFAIAALCLIFPYLAVPILLVLTYSAARYSGMLTPSRALWAPTVVLGMQTVPPFALLELIRRLGFYPELTPGWKKIPR